MVQNSQKLKASWDSVPLRMQELCIISVNYQSLRVSPSSLAILLKLSKSATPLPWLSQMLKTLVRPSLDLLSPTLETTISRNSSNLMGLLTALRPLIISKTMALLPLRPSSSRIFSTSTGSMVPPPSSSNRSKVALSSSQSTELSLSFQEVDLPAATGAGPLELVTAVLLPFILKIFLQIKMLKYPLMSCFWFQNYFYCNHQKKYCSWSLAQPSESSLPSGPHQKSSQSCSSSACRFRSAWVSLTFLLSSAPRTPTAPLLAINPTMAPLSPRWSTPTSLATSLSSPASPAQPLTHLSSTPAPSRSLAMSSSTPQYPTPQPCSNQLLSRLLSGLISS